MCPECLTLYAKLSDLNAALIAQTNDLASLPLNDEEQYQGRQAELVQLRLACTEARQELKEHRQHH